MDLTATERVFITPELLEQILLRLQDQLLPLTDQEDPRSVKTHSNSTALQHLLRCTEVNTIWQQTIVGSKRLQRALFLASNVKSSRSWSIAGSVQSEEIQLRSYYRAPTMRAPILNPIIQSTFPSYHFRFWRLSLEASGNKYTAYMIITRRDLPAIHTRFNSVRGRSISNTVSYTHLTLPTKRIV